MTSTPGGSAKCSRTGRPSLVSKGGAASARAARGRLGAGLALTFTTLTSSWITPKPKEAAPVPGHDADASRYPGPPHSRAAPWVPSTPANHHALREPDTSPPADGRANAAVIRAVARWADVAPSQVAIVSDAAARYKLVEIDREDALPPPAA
ncbi:MAG: DUF167 domain-containing protein [Streptosporangiaceae bacterium]